MKINLETELVIPRKEYRSLINIAISARKLIDYDKQEGFDFMVDAFKAEITKTLEQDYLEYLR
jgi:hypothetical protein